jgi:phosphorylase kinase alpha/beta subunit
VNQIYRQQADWRSRLETYYVQVQETILSRQHPITGLLPASTAITEHGDYTDAWVRDNVYSILAAWGLALAYRKLDDSDGRAYELEHTVIKLMRGLLTAMMKQADKVERFKHSQDPLHALHAKYATATGDTVVGDADWGHLQLDATSLFLLMLAQMTASGLRIVFTLDEVNFVQNLVFYISRAYQTPDYGIWERGNKLNHGSPELNVSSVGMAKAALEAMSECNLFGLDGGQSSIIHVLPDAIARTRVTVESLLPRESSSKEVDAALLSIIGYPAYAVENEVLVEQTRRKIQTQLEGGYGCKRFLRDGHQTALEDTSRLHYEPEELRQFEHIECEWPLFFTYFVLDGFCRQDDAQVSTYRDRLRSLLVERNGQQLLPELYFVPADRIEAERVQPGSQPRQPNLNLPLIWAQSLFLLGEMLAEGLLAVGDIDPLGRRLRVGRQPAPVVQLALLAQDEDLQRELETYGISTQTPGQIAPIQLWRAEHLGQAYTQVGRNDRLGLSGCPPQRIRSLTTAKIFRLRGELAVFLPSFLDHRQFYLTLDYHFLVAKIKSELAYLQHHWNEPGRPTLVLLISRAMLAAGSTALLEFIQELQQGRCSGTAVRLGRLNELLLAASRARIDYLHDLELRRSPIRAEDTSAFLRSDPAASDPLGNVGEFLLECETDVSVLLQRLQQTGNLYEQVEVLGTLARLRGLSFDTGFGRRQGLYVTVEDLLNELYNLAGTLKLWAIVRRTAGLLNKVDIGLVEAVTDILVRQKLVAVGKAYSEDSVISRPLSQGQIVEKIRAYCSEDVREHVLTQEILIFLSLLIKAEPHLFQDSMTLRVSSSIQLITGELASELNLTQDEAYEHLMQLSPFEVKQRLREVLEGYDRFDRKSLQQESLHVRAAISPSASTSAALPSVEELPLPNADEPKPAAGWLRKRRLEGSLNRLSPQFYQRVWGILHHCRGLTIGDKFERRNRLDSQRVLSEMTAGERNFAVAVEHLLNKIPAPEYRQLTVEALVTLAIVTEANPHLHIDDVLIVDVLIGHAVRLAWLSHHPEQTELYRYNSDLRAQAWSAFYQRSPHECARAVTQALSFLIQMGRQDSPPPKVESLVG